MNFLRANNTEITSPIKRLLESSAEHKHLWIIIFNERTTHLVNCNLFAIYVKQYKKDLYLTTRSDTKNILLLTESAKLHALRAHVPNMPCMLKYSHDNVSCVLMCSRANVSCVLTYSRANVPYVLTCSSAKVLVQ